MPDITMCTNSKCPLRQHCYRYRAVPDEYWQSFCMFEPQERVGSPMYAADCDRFWDIRGHQYKVLPTEQIDERNKK